jgi:hypothetical protein
MGATACAVAALALLHTATAAPGAAGRATAPHGTAGVWRRCAVEDYGAVAETGGAAATRGDDSAAIHAALAACGGERGGEVVLRGPGTYDAGPMNLTSNQVLHVGAGAVLQAPTPKSGECLTSSTPCPYPVVQVRKTPSWPRSWANVSILSLYSHRNAWANLHLLGQPNTFLAAVVPVLHGQPRLRRALPARPLHRGLHGAQHLDHRRRHDRRGRRLLLAGRQGC